MTDKKFAYLSTLILLLTLTAASPLLASDKLLHPDQLNEQAPEKFQVKFETSKGDVVIEVTRRWAPIGADRFYNLTKNGFYDGARFYRVISRFMVQFGFNGDPEISKAWAGATIRDDQVLQSNGRGYITFAKTGAPNSRTTQLFINFVNNSNLDGMGFAPFGKVVKGMDVVDKLYSGYGEGAPSGQGPSQTAIRLKGNAYLEKGFPNLDYIIKATILEEAAPAKAPAKAPTKPKAAND